MIGLTLLTAALAADTLGPLPPDTTLRETVTHPEFVRYHLSADRDFIIELTASPPEGTERESAPVCSGGGVDLWVRLDAKSDGESFDWDPLPAIVDQACERLARHAPDLRGRQEMPPEPADGAVQGAGAPLTEVLTRSTIWPWRPLHAVVIGWFALLLVAAPRSARAWGLGAAALALRVALSPRRLLLGGDAAYERLLTAQGLEGSNPYYGDGWWAFMGLLWKALGEPLDHVMGANLVLSALAVPLLYGAVQALTRDRRAATLAAAALALMPLAIALSGSEEQFVLAATLQVAAVYGAARGDRSGAVFAALSAGLLAHLRPMQGLFTLLPLGLLAARRRWGALALGAGLVGWRGVEIVRHLLAEGRPPVTENTYLEWWDLLPGAKSAVVALNPSLSPIALALLALLLLDTPPDREEGRRPALVLLGAFVLGALPYVPLIQSTGADPLRFQLPTLSWLAALAALAWPWFTDGRGRPVPSPGRLALLGLLAWSWWSARAPIGTPWAWTSEYRFLAAEAPRVPGDVTVRYDASQDPNHVFHLWLNDVSPADWLPFGEDPPAEGEWIYVGTADRIAGRKEAPRCAEVAVQTFVPSASDGWVDFGDEDVRLGLYKVIPCDEAQ
jgi:hypothetical protein